MQKLFKLLFVISFSAVAISCGNSGNKNNTTLQSKKDELEKLKKDKAATDNKIAALQKDIDKIDTTAADKQKAKLVAITPVVSQDFKHYIQLQGSVDDKNVSYITPSGQGGQIKAIYLKQGDLVKKGQLVLKLDDAVSQQNVLAVKQQLGSVKAQLELAKSLYDRQKNLWDQHIGTEVQLLQDKTNVEALENQLKTIQANVNASQAQSNQSNVYSDVSGTVDEVTAHVGESFTGNPMAGGYIKIVNNAQLKITAIVPENYAGNVTKGSTVEVAIPDVNKTFISTISFLSQSVGANTRGLTAQIKVPDSVHARPNQVVIVRILDYSKANSIVINVNTLQTDLDGKFVLVAAKEGDNSFARKRKVQIGQTNGEQVEIKDGLKDGDQLITEGYQSLYDGQIITTANSGN